MKQAVMGIHEAAVNHFQRWLPKLSPENLSLQCPAIKLMPNLHYNTYFALWMFEPDNPIMQVPNFLTPANKLDIFMVESAQKGIGNTGGRNSRNLRKGGYHEGRNLPKSL